METALDRAEDMLTELASSIDYSIVGPRDNRTRVTQTRIFPYNTICYLGRNYTGNNWSGVSGVLISPRMVLTAGHCVYSHAQGGFPRRIRVMPGRFQTSGGPPFGHIDTVRYLVPQRYVTSRDRGYDYGLIILPRAFRGITRFMPPRALPDRSFEEMRRRGLITVAGYPADKPVGTLWRHSEQLRRFDARRLYYPVDTCPGHSGSPIYYHCRRENRLIVIGVHTTGVPGFRCRPGSPLAPPGSVNSGVRVTADMLADIRNPDRTVNGVRTMVGHGG